MKTLMRITWVIICLVGITACTTGDASAQEAILADHTFVSAFDQITAETFETIRNDYRFFYGHTSHGSQIVSGLNILENINSTQYDYPYFHEISDDLGHNGDTSWVTPTRTWLTDNPDCNMVMWSWCGGCSDNSVAGIETYLAAMEQLEADYPGVTFIYMTGHLDGGGIDGNLYLRNNQIRAYCAANKKVLFDFADIESWDPEGNYYPDENDACAWCDGYCPENNCDTCEYCAHSHCFNCYQKGKAFWAMMAAVAGAPISPVRDVPAVADIELHNFPNPFNPQTEIFLRIGQSGFGSLAVYDVAGNLVSEIYSGHFSAGEQSFLWQGQNDHGQALGSGMYICRLTLAGKQKDIKITLLK